MKTELQTIPDVAEKGKKKYVELGSQYRLLEETNEEKNNDISKRSQNSIQ